MATNALPLDTPMLPPLVLRPPLGPAVLRALVLILASIFHVVTAGWSRIIDGSEGDIAGAARLLLHDRRWFPVPAWGSVPPEAPLSFWLTKASLSEFGVSEFAARLPVALAVLASVWLTIRIAERHGGIWRGFAAGMILLCSPGMFTAARILTSAPLATVFITASIYCLVCGSKRRPGRRQWYCLAWLAMALAVFAGGWRSAAVPLGTILILLAFYREARIRFRALISWEAVAISAVTIAGGIWCSAAQPSVPVDIAVQSAAWLPGMLFPWSLLLLPAAWSTVMRAAKGRGVEWPEGIVLAWIGAGLAVAFASPGGFVMHSIPVWPAFAIWAALRLETLSRRSLLRAMGAMLGLSAVGLVLAAQMRTVLPVFCPVRARVIADIPETFWPSVTPVVFIAVLAFTMFGAAAFSFEWQNRRRFTLIALFGAMIPAGYAFSDITAKFAPYFSAADLAHCIDASRYSGFRIAVDGNRLEASSLRFYLQEPPRCIESVSPEKALVAVGGSPRLFLVTRRDRIAAWNGTNEKRWRVECEFGGRVVLAGP